MINPETNSPAAIPLRSELLSSVAGVIHGITHRVEGLGKADGNIGETAPRDREDAWEMRQIWSREIGFDPMRLVRTGQVHEADVFRVTEEHAGMGRNWQVPIAGTSDAMITNEPYLPIMTLHADCLPLLMCDPERGVVAAVHAGWRSTVMDIAGATVRSFVHDFGSRPEDILAFLGPAIGGCCNEVGPEVTTAWRAQARDLGALAELAVTRPGPKEHFDVPRANTLLLHRAGLIPDHIEVSPICTKCTTDEWFSHRGHGPLAGRQGAAIMLTDQGVRS